MATTTSTPRRIPITTPKPTTTTQSTTTPTTPETTTEKLQETSKDSEELLGETNELVINREPGEPDDKVDTELTKERAKFKFIFHVDEGHLFTPCYQNFHFQQ